MNSPKEVPADSEEIQDDAVHRCEALEMGRRLEAPHVTLALPRRLMRHFGAVVRVAVRAVGDRWHHQPVRGGITPQLIGDQAAGETALALQ